jgi:hypothetical protein
MGFVCINCVVLIVLEYNVSVICKYNLISYDILCNNSDTLWNRSDPLETLWILVILDGIVSHEGVFVKRGAIFSHKDPKYFP